MIYLAKITALSGALAFAPGCSPHPIRADEAAINRWQKDSASQMRLEAKVERKAFECGVKPQQLTWQDHAGKRVALVSPYGDLENFSFKSLACLINWARDTGAPVSFVAAPSEEQPN